MNNLSNHFKRIVLTSIAGSVIACYHPPVCCPPFAAPVAPIGVGAGVGVGIIAIAILILIALGVIF
ncbi:MAG TPA: hypothetical protein VFC84_09230 [Desulfosporosinus sp.]|nr:hypothetical protein [Desulfosporosinus sp.]